MDMKEMIVAVVYQRPDGLAPADIVGAIKRDFNVQTNTKEVLQIVSKNRKLFSEVGGKIKSPSVPS